MPKKAEAPKGGAFLPQSSASGLIDMAKRATNGIDSVKYTAMHMRKCGWEIDHIAEGLGRSPETIRRWLTQAHREGIDSVPHVKKGAPCRLSVEERGQLAFDITSTRPIDHGLDGSTWDYKTVRLYIKKKFGKEYTYNGTHRLLQRMGIRPMAPRPAHPNGLNEEEQYEFKRASRALAQSLYKQGFKVQGGVDEVHVVTNERPTKGLGMKGARPMSVPSSVDKGRLSCFVALVEAAMYIMRAEKNANTAEFIRFCEMLLNLVDKAVIWVDNARYHKSKRFEKYLEENRSRLRVIYLPEYTPDLAVAETAMGPIKRAVARRSPKNRDEVWKAMCDAAAAGDLPVNKLFGWMRIHDPDPEPTVRAPKYEYDDEMIIVRSDSLPEPAPKRARIKSASGAGDVLTFEEFKKLPAGVFDSAGDVLGPFVSLPTGALRNMSAGLCTP